MKGLLAVVFCCALAACSGGTTASQTSKATGTRALARNKEGINNIALGYSAGSRNRTGSSNIWIGSLGEYPGSQDDNPENNSLHIGNGTGTDVGELDRAFISGIANATGVFDQDVCVDSSTGMAGSDQLGPCGESSAASRKTSRT